MPNTSEVHIWHGLNDPYFCGFSDKVPAEWPKGHYAVTLENAGAITCEGCTEKLWPKVPPEPTSA